SDGPGSSKTSSKVSPSRISMRLSVLRGGYSGAGGHAKALAATPGQKLHTVGSAGHLRRLRAPAAAKLPTRLAVLIASGHTNRGGFAAGVFRRRRRSASDSVPARP